MIRIGQISLRLNEDKKAIPHKIAKKLGIRLEDILFWKIAKESVDARKKSDIRFIYAVDIQLSAGLEQKILTKWLNMPGASVHGKFRTQIRGKYKTTFTPKVLDVIKTPDETYVPPAFGTMKITGRPVIAGFGPCGMFAALLLSEMGYMPIILERGKTVDQRAIDTEEFWENSKFNIDSNTLFGEGGAGTFSDGKLTTQIKDIRIGKVLEELVAAGAPQDILYKQKPHIGTDLLQNAVKEIRNKIISLGGEFRFECRLEGIKTDSSGRLETVYYRRTCEDARCFDDQSGLYNDHYDEYDRHSIGYADEHEDEHLYEYAINTNVLILAIGHSARDTIQKLHDSGVIMEQKPFSMGVRIEHLQQTINQAQFGTHAGNPKLGAAEYKLSHHTDDGRGVYTFCMCPGGFVIAATSEDGMLVTNGMSKHDRAGQNANSAILVDVRKEDFVSTHPLAGIEFQRKWERETFLLGGGDYSAPVQRLGDFMKGVKSGEKTAAEICENDVGYLNGGGAQINPTYRPGVKWACLSECLPSFVVAALREAFPVFGRRLCGFDHPNAVLTAIESRSSSPVRIVRDKSFQSNVRGIYPAGEGAGYAGGIISSAVDGIKAAEKIIETFSPFGPE